MPVRIIPPPIRSFRKNGRPLAPRKRTEGLAAASLTAAGVRRGRPKRSGQRTTPTDALLLDASSGTIMMKPVRYGGRDDGQSTRAKGKRVLMFGWELPPFNSGGLGVASYGLAKALSFQGADITFVLPRRVNVDVPFMKLVFASDEPFPMNQQELYGAYARPTSGKRMPGMKQQLDVHGSLLEEVVKYAQAAARIARSQRHDIIHAHDWLSFPAGLVGKSISHAPMVAHVHATEFDRSGDNVDQTVSSIEQEGCNRADRVIAVSDFTRQQLLRHYGVAQAKMDVIYNGVNTTLPLVQSTLTSLKESGKKIVLFVGRITMQKGPDYFLRAAAHVARYEPNAMFLMAGSGDMERQMILLAAQLGISDRMLFVGFLRDRELASIYRSADVFVMPSISEPFGITALESMAHETPVIVSRQSGVSELVRHALKVDFWDIQEMAHKILAVIRYQSLKHSLSLHAREEVQAYTWEKAAQECLRVYEKVL